MALSQMDVEPNPCMWTECLLVELCIIMFLCCIAYVDPSSQVDMAESEPTGILNLY